MNKTTAYHKHIKNSEFETKEVFEQETENIPLILQTDLITTLHHNPLTQSMDSSKHSERHKTEVNPYPEPSSSYSSETSSSDSREKKKKRNKKKNARSKTPLKPKAPFKWVFIVIVPSTSPKSLTSAKTFSNYLLIVNAYSKIPKLYGTEKITTEEVMDKLDMFQSR